MTFSGHDDSTINIVLVLLLLLLILLLLYRPGKQMRGTLEMMFRLLIWIEHF